MTELRTPRGLRGDVTLTDLALLVIARAHLLLAQAGLHKARANGRQPDVWYWEREVLARLDAAWEAQQRAAPPKAASDFQRIVGLF